MEKLKFYKSGNEHFLREELEPVEPLSKAIYLVCFDPKRGGFFLERLYDKFHIGHKIYGMETKWIERAVKTYHETEGSLGVLFNGVKGTGKTVTSKLLCNALELPTLIVSQQFDGIADWISKIPYDISLMFDEFEKTYPLKYDSNSDILTVMDGVLSNQYRRVWLLTTNNTYINDNLLERPGRIRYHKEYKDLDKETIEEVVDDLLVYKERKEETIEFISMLETITIDIIKAIISEINIHNENPKEFASFFNIKKASIKYNIFKTSADGTKELWLEDVSVRKIDDTKPNQELNIDGRWQADIISIIGKNSYIVSHDKDDLTEYPAFNIRIEELSALHSSYRMVL